ncbi:MAG: hypothetical protein WAL71_17120 [Terriglobales bacterium]|jgi:hypothetical protein
MPPRRKIISPPDDQLFAAKRRKPIPFEFVLDALAPAAPSARPMFGCLAVYVREKIVLILRDKSDGTVPKSILQETNDNGVWLATTKDHHESLGRDFPNMRSIGVLGKKVTGWQVLPADAPDFEEAAMRACDLILAGDPRIGKIPGERRKASSAKKSKKNAKSRKRT